MNTVTYCEDDLTGITKLYYTGNGNYDRIIVKETGQLFDHFSNPVISTFLSGLSPIELPVKDGVYPITVCFLRQVPDAELGCENELCRVNILSDFLDTDELYMNGFYHIDKAYCTNDRLFLKGPISQLDDLYVVHSVTRFVSNLSAIKQRVTDKILRFSTCSKREKEWIQDTLLKLELIQLTADGAKQQLLYKSISI